MLKNTYSPVMIMLFAALSLGSAAAQTPISTPYLPSADNFRDVAGISATYGGTGFANETAHGGVMRTGVFYRSTDLNGLTPADLETISRLGIVRVIDLRTPSEITANPDIPPIGAVEVNYNIFATPSPPPPPTSNVTLAVVDTYMRNTYRDFVDNPQERAALHNVLLDLATTQGAELYHCSAGKDRTGWTSMLLESIAGVSPAKIMQDYLATNLYTAASINAQSSLGVQPDFLQAGLDQVTAVYGSMYAYLTQGLGLTQEDLYVLRAKMVYYSTLPGEALLTGNAASGAALLKSLQNSLLSGHYTAYNSYLQSAIDAGTLGGVQTRIGGQVHADTAATLTRVPQGIDDSIASNTTGMEIKPGTSKVWGSGFAGYQDSSSHSGSASSDTRNSGVVVGGTRRVNVQTSTYLGAGFVASKVDSVGASADVDNYLMVLGGRYAFPTLDAGPYISARMIAGTVDYASNRPLGANLGTASGKTNGTLYSGRVDYGNIFAWRFFTITPQIGAVVTHANLNGFAENGSELALHVDSISHTIPSLVAELRIDIKESQLGGWALQPTAMVGYERAMDTSSVTSTGTLYGYSLNQESAYDSRNIAKIGVGITARKGVVTLLMGANAMAGEDTRSIAGANFTLVCSF